MFSDSFFSFMNKRITELFGTNRLSSFLNTSCFQETTYFMINILKCFTELEKFDEPILFLKRKIFHPENISLSYSRSTK